MIRRPPRSTLFPYTTLFRSHGVRPVKRAFGAVHDFNFVDVVESEVGEIHVAAGKIHGSSIDKHFGESGVAAINKDGGKAADRAGARKADARLRGQKIGKEDGLALLDFLRADDVNRGRRVSKLGRLRVSGDNYVGRKRRKAEAKTEDMGFPGGEVDDHLARSKG